jgi:hypothetical protein
MVNNRRNSFTLMYLFSVGAYWHVISCCFLTELWLFVFIGWSTDQCLLMYPSKANDFLTRGFLASIENKYFCPVDFSLYRYIIPFFTCTMVCIHLYMCTVFLLPGNEKCWWCDVHPVIYKQALGLFYQIIQVLHHVAAFQQRPVGTSRGSFRLYTDTQSGGRPDKGQQHTQTPCIMHT